MKLTRRGVIATLGATAFAGCSGMRNDDDGLSETDINLLLNWTPNGLHTPYYVARERGYYEEEGFEDVTIESGQGADFSAQQAGLGNTEFGITSSEQLINVNTRGLSPRCVGVVMQQGQVVVFTARELFGEELTDVSQIEGKTVGSSPGAVRLMSENFFAQHGIMDTLDWVDTGFDTIQQLLNGNIDVACGVFSEIVDAEQQGYTIDSIDVADTISSYGHVVATGESFAEDNPNIVEAFLRATARGFTTAMEDTEEATDILVNSVSELGELRENQRLKWELMADEYVLSDAVAEHGWGWSEPGPWEETYRTLDDGGMLEDDIDPETVWTNEYLDRESQYIGNFIKVIA